MEDGKRMLGWAIKHNSHGIYYDTLIFLPEGDAPETKHEWIRVPWLDEPKKKPKTTRKKQPEKLNETHVNAITNN